MKKILKQFSFNKKKIVKTVAMVGLTGLMSTPAYASEVGALTTAVQGLVDILTGTTAQLIAVVAIAGIGWSWSAGHLSLKQASTIALGIGVIFGAPEIASLLGAG